MGEFEQEVILVRLDNSKLGVNKQAFEVGRVKTTRECMPRNTEGNIEPTIKARPSEILCFSIVFMYCKYALFLDLESMGDTNVKL